MTNDVIRPVLERFFDVPEASTKYHHFRLVDHMNLQAFLGILYLRAALRVSLRSINTIWHDESSNNLFSAPMSNSCFKFISRFITFDNKASRTERLKTDRFTCMRELFQLINVGNVKWRYPSPMLSVDETLYLYRGAICFKQQNPNKPAKCGLLSWSLCDSTTTYANYILPCAANPEVVEGDVGTNYVTGTKACIRYLVNKISNYSSIQGCNILFNRYFTAVSFSRMGFRKKDLNCGYHEAWSKGNTKVVEILQRSRIKVSPLCLPRGEKRDACVIHWQQEVG